MLSFVTGKECQLRYFSDRNVFHLDSGLYFIDYDCYETLKNAIILNGDEKAFREYILSDSLHPLDRLAYSLYMSNHYDNVEASAQVYKEMMQWPKLSGRDSLDSDSKDLAQYYLDKCYRLDSTFSIK